MNIKYSIVIPTRNRAEYLPYAILSVLDSSRTDFELIVSNNFSTDDTDAILSKIVDPRLRVISPSASLPMTSHYEYAISHARGEWVTILGADDAVMPNFFNSLDLHIKKFPEIEIISFRRAYYFWCGCEDLYGKIVVSYFSKLNYQIRSTKKDLYDVMRGVRDCFDLPQMYTTGIVKRSLYEEIKENSNGIFYHSIIPDMYSAVALCLSRDEYLRIDDPLFWVGTSNKSMGRSDRIYIDSFYPVLGVANPKVNPVSTLSKEVSYYLHSCQFGSLYVFECLLKSPLYKNRANLDILKIIVLSDVYIRSWLKSSAERSRIIGEINNEFIKYKISKIKFIEYLFYNILSKVFNLIINSPYYVIKSLHLMPNSYYIRSNDRVKFFNIIEASNMINKIRSISLND